MLRERAPKRTPSAQHDDDDDDDDLVCCIFFLKWAPNCGPNSPYKMHGEITTNSNRKIGGAFVDLTQKCQIINLTLVSWFGYMSF
jgi:hypothetical protein